MNEDEIIRVVQQTPGLPPAASLDAVISAEEAVGFHLPPFLRRLYLEAANGGFGPRKGVLGVAGSDYLHGEWRDIVEINGASESEEEVDRPGLLWLFEWGEGIWSIVDCLDPDEAMWVWDPNVEPSLFRQNMTLVEWLEASFGGNLELAFETSSLGDIADRLSSPEEPAGVLPRITRKLPRDELVDAICRVRNLPAPASISSVSSTEDALGFSFPPLLRRLYLEVANGGFGPGQGVLRVPSDINFRSNDILEYNQAFKMVDNLPVWPGLIWLNNWGHAIWTLVDCRDEMGAMWGWDPMGPFPHVIGNEGSADALFPLNMSLDELLTGWLDGAFGHRFHPSSLRPMAIDRAGG